ncbi:Deoxyuridine 5'-triphosphate nucleotidohydrolase, partial [Stegodyphus mimosarum]
MGRGEIAVILYNHTDEIFEIKAGYRIAQMILLKYGKHIPVQCLPEEISTTKRGEKVFRSFLFFFFTMYV